MLKYEKVPERSKSRLKLKDIGFQGLISCLGDVPGSTLLFRCLSEQVLGAGTEDTRPPSLWDHHPSQAGTLVAFGDSGEVSLCWLSLSTDPPNYKDLVAVVSLSHRAELSIRLDMCRKVSREGTGGQHGRGQGGHHGR